MAYQKQLETVDVTITNGQSLSGAATLDGKAVVGILMPAAWTAAGLSFQKSADGSTYGDVSDKNGEVTVASAGIQTGARTWIDLDPALFANAQAIKVRSGTRSAAVNQAADRVLTLILAPVL
jgi:hypothetical protein